MNSIFNDVNKKRVVSTLFLYLLIFSLGCDFKSPQKWETPSWYLPLTLPLVNKVYSFEGIVDSSTIFADSLTNVTQIVFGDSLPANGISDDTFNIEMSSSGLDAPDIGMEEISVPVAGFSIPPITIPMPNSMFNDLTKSGTCFPLSHVGLLQSSIDAAQSLMNGSLPMELGLEECDEICIKKLIVDKGSWNLKITNDWSVPLEVTFTLINGEDADSIKYKKIFDTISPYETAADPAPITSSAPTVLDINSEFNYSIDIEILDDDANYGNQTFNCEGYKCGNQSEFIISGGFDNMVDCNNAPFCLCEPYPGWENKSTVSEMLTIEFSASFDKIGSVVADVNIEAPSIDPIAIDIPSIQGMSITKAKFADSNQDFPNQFQLNITNGFIADLNMTMNFNNIFNHADDSLTDALSVPMKIEPGNTLNEIIDISDKFLADGADSEQPVGSIEIAYEVDFASGEYTIDVVNDSMKIGMPSINSIEVTNLRLEYIYAVADSLPFPSIESPPIEGIPDGFSGFEFYDIFMEMDFFSEIGVPVGLNMELLGSKEGIVDTKVVAINTEIGAPYKDNYGCTFNKTGDTARTVIRLNKDFQKTEYYCSPYDSEPSEVDIVEFENIEGGNNTSIVDLMNFAPENIGIGGGVVIDGPGILAPNSKLWGTFTMIAPLAFIFEQPINIIPAEPTAMEPIESSTAQQIDSSLVETALNVTISNNSPLGGSLSLLISDSTIFPLFLDSLVTGSWNSQLYNFNTAIWDTLREDLTDDVIDSVSVIPIDSTDENTKALEVKFYNDDSLQFFIGRMFELGFPRADSIEYHLGYANPEFPNIDTSSMVIDSIRMDWVITDEPRYNIAMMTFDSSPIQFITDTDTAYIPLTFQTTNTIGVQAYFTLLLDAGGLGRDSNSNDK